MIVRLGLPVDDVVPGLVLEAAVVDQSHAAGPVHDVVLEEVPAGGHVAVEEVGAAVVGPAVPHQVVVDADVGEAALLQPRLGAAIALRALGASLDTAEVVGDADTEVVDIVVLYVDHELIRVIVIFALFITENHHGASRGSCDLIVCDQDISGSG